MLTGSVAVWLVWPHGPVQKTAVQAGPTDPNPLSRAASCDGADLPALVARASDADWRVRAAAYSAISRIAPLEEPPLRDTPIDQREKLLLGWLDRHAPGLADDLCEVYAQADYLRFGKALVERCQVCHAGPRPTPRFADTSCTSCHGQAHRQWAGTAHANSLSHLRLATVDPITRQQGVFDFGQRKGMSCIACHEPQPPSAPVHGTAAVTDTATAGHKSTQNAWDFKTVACGVCHTQAQSQWQAWRDAPRYRRAAWPPGSVELAGDEPLGCVDCHMPNGDHLWAARRDIDLLRNGITLKISRDPQGRTVLSLRNLAGHAYPTGTIRRGLRLFAQSDDQPERLIVTLADGLSNSAEPPRTDTALRPGEERRFLLAGRPRRVRARLVYLRNRFQTAGYTAEIMAVDRTFTGPETAVSD
jgi:Cytochrome c554 and c-prime